MIDIFDQSKLALFVAFVVPGFIAIKVYELMHPSQYKESSKQFIDAVSYSSFNFGIWMVPIFYAETCNLREVNPTLYTILYFSALFLSPIAMVIFWAKLRRTNWLQKYAPHPTLKPWDFVFSQRTSNWIIVTLNNGHKVAGLYASNSFASSSPANPEIYLEEEWLLNSDGGFDRAVHDSAGIMILGDNIRCVEFYNNEVEDNE